jgi:hypothetical protein
VPPAFERSADAKPNAKTANAITIYFFDMIDIPPVVSRIEPNNHGEVAKESAPSCIHGRRHNKSYRWRVGQFDEKTALFPKI